MAAWSSRSMTLGPRSSNRHVVQAADEHQQHQREYINPDVDLAAGITRPRRSNRQPNTRKTAAPRKWLKELNGS